MLRILPIFLITPAFPAAASAAPADIDRGYGADGRAILDSGGGDDIDAMAVQPDGKTVVAASTAVKGDGVVMRFTLDGAPDPTFGGGDGVAIVESDGAEWLNAIAVQPDGKIVVAGGTTHRLRTASSAGSMPTARPTSSSAPTAWRSSTAPGTKSSGAVAVQPDGRIVAAGETSVDSALAAYRLTSQGKPDNTFDEDGARGIDAGGADDGYAVALQADGKIVVAGTTDQGPRVPARSLASTPTGSPTRRSGPAAGGAAPTRASSTPSPSSATGASWPRASSGRRERRCRLPPPARHVRPDVRGQGQDPARPRRRRGGVLPSRVQRRRQDRRRRRGRPSATTRSSGGCSATAAAIRRSATDGAAILGGAGLRVGRQRRPAARRQDRAGLRVQRPATATCSWPVCSATPGRPRSPSRAGSSRPPRSSAAAAVKATIVGTPRRDVIRGTRRRDVIAALGGNDVVRGLGGNDVICGGAGRDRLLGGAGPRQA